MSEALRRLLEQPAALTEQQVMDLRAMVSEARAVLDRERDEEHFIRQVFEERNVIFETLDGLRAFGRDVVVRLEGGFRYVLKRPVRRLVARVVSEKPDPLESSEVRTYEFKEFVGGRSTGRIPVYVEVAR